MVSNYFAAVNGDQDHRRRRWRTCRTRPTPASCRTGEHPDGDAASPHWPRSSAWRWPCLAAGRTGRPPTGVALGLLLSYSGQPGGQQHQLGAGGADGGRGGQRRGRRGAAGRCRCWPGTRAATRQGAARRPRSCWTPGRRCSSGPTPPTLAVQLRSLFDQQTLILPSYTTAHHPFRKPNWWFVMGAGTARVACELCRPAARRRPQGAGGAGRPQRLQQPGGVGAGAPPRHDPDRAARISRHRAARCSPSPPRPPTRSCCWRSRRRPRRWCIRWRRWARSRRSRRWYLSPTLHTPALLETIPKGALAGARGRGAGHGGGGGGIPQALPGALAGRSRSTTPTRSTTPPRWRCWRWSGRTLASGRSHAARRWGNTCWP